jgi:hypothetical protein
MHALLTGTNITPLGDTYAVLIVDVLFSLLVGGRLFMWGHANKRATKPRSRG